MEETCRVRIDVWSDYVCPFCYLEEPVLDQIQQEYKKVVQVVWRAFELRPEPAPTLDPDGEYLHDIWGRAVYPMARERGMTLRLPPLQPRSRRALESAEFAREQGRAAAMNHALFKAFFEDGRDLNDVDVLVETAFTVGLDGEQLRTALLEGRYTDQVLEDERLAHRLGVNGVPAMFVRAANGPLEAALVLSGAQPYERLRQAVEQTLANCTPG